jgi:hypothetical protein
MDSVIWRASTWTAVYVALIARNAGDVEIVDGRADGSPGVLNMFAQVHPSGPGGSGGKDTRTDRLRYFAKCLARIKTAFEAGMYYAKSTCVQVHTLFCRHVFMRAIMDRGAGRLS